MPPVVLQIRGQPSLREIRSEYCWTLKALRPCLHRRRIEVVVTYDPNKLRGHDILLRRHSMPCRWPWNVGESSSAKRGAAPSCFMCVSSCAATGRTCCARANCLQFPLAIRIRDMGNGTYKADFHLAESKHPNAQISVRQKDICTSDFGGLGQALRLRGAWAGSFSLLQLALRFECRLCATG